MAVLDGYFRREDGGEVNIINVSLIKLIPSSIEYMLWAGTQSDCLKAFKEHYPSYDPGTAFWISGTQQEGQLWIPANYYGEKKATP